MHDASFHKGSELLQQRVELASKLLILGIGYSCGFFLSLVGPHFRVKDRDVVLQQAHDTHPQPFDEVHVAALLVDTDLHDLDHLRHHVVHLADPHQRGLHRNRTDREHCVDFVGLPNVFVLECLQTDVQELHDLFVVQLLLTNFQNVGNQQECTFNYFFIFCVNSDADNFIQIGQQLVAENVSLDEVACHQNAVDAVSSDDVPVAHVVHQGAHYFDSALGACGLHLFRELLQHHTDSVQLIRTCPDVTNLELIIKHVE